MVFEAHLSLSLIIKATWSCLFISICFYLFFYGWLQPSGAVFCVGGCSLVIYLSFSPHFQILFPLWCFLSFTNMPRAHGFLFSLSYLIFVAWAIKDVGSYFTTIESCFPPLRVKISVNISVLVSAHIVLIQFLLQNPFAASSLIPTNFVILFWEKANFSI